MSLSRTREPPAHSLKYFREWLWKQMATKTFQSLFQNVIMTGKREGWYIKLNQGNQPQPSQNISQFLHGKRINVFAKENLHLCPLLFAVFPRMLRVSHSLELDLFPCTQDDNLYLKCKHNEKEKIKVNLTSTSTGNVVYSLMLSHRKEINKNFKKSNVTST